MLGGKYPDVLWLLPEFEHGFGRQLIFSEMLFVCFQSLRKVFPRLEFFPFNHTLYSDRKMRLAKIYGLPVSVALRRVAH